MLKFTAPVSPNYLQKYIYTEETNKAKEKYEKQEKELCHYKGEAQLLAEKLEKYDTHVRSISKQVYKLNEQNLEVKKENEFLKNKLRLAESNPRESRLFSAANFGKNLNKWKKKSKTLSV